ncbi:MAG: hypothetical protein ACI9KE_000301 [Polyangiales bacterium]
MARAENTNVPGPAWKEDTKGYSARGVPDRRASNFAKYAQKTVGNFAVLSDETCLEGQISEDGL